MLERELTQWEFRADIETPDLTGKEPAPNPETNRQSQRNRKIAKKFPVDAREI